MSVGQTVYEAVGRNRNGRIVEALAPASDGVPRWRVELFCPPSTVEEAVYIEEREDLLKILPRTPEARTPQDEWVVMNGHEIDGCGFVGFWASGPVRGSRSEAEADIPRADKAQRKVSASDYFDMRCPECGEMLTSHVVTTRHATGPCDENFTGPELPRPIKAEPGVFAATLGGRVVYSAPALSHAEPVQRSGVEIYTQGHPSDEPMPGAVDFEIGRTLLLGEEPVHDQAEAREVYMTLAADRRDGHMFIPPRTWTDEVGDAFDAGWHAAQRPETARPDPRVTRAIERAKALVTGEAMPGASLPPEAKQRWRELYWALDVLMDEKGGAGR